jgi:RNA polymerase sigma-70 factor (ECF subfamily)
VGSGFGNPGLAVLSSVASDRKTSAPARVEPDVIAACRRGDRQALETVFRAHADVIERLLCRLIGPRADVEDLLQDTFAAAIDAFPRFRGEASVGTWLHRIAVNVARHHLRSPRHRREILCEDSNALAADRNPEESVDSQDLTRCLYAHLDALDPAKRIALVLYVIEERSVAEVAALTGASEAATKSRLFWARRALLKRLRRDPQFNDERGAR